MKCPACGADLLPADDVCSECGAPQPRLARAFADAAPRFVALAARNESGEMDSAAYEAEFQELLVEDDEGGYWMFETNEGEWYRYESEQWTRKDPPLSIEPEHPPLQETPPLLPPQYAEAKQRFAALSARYEAGELDDNAYEAEFQELLVEDDAGSYWMFSANDGEWYYHNGEEWTQGNPPLEAAPVEALAVQATSPGKMKLQPAEVSSATTAKSSPAIPTAPGISNPLASDVAQGSEGVICQTCGKQNALGAHFCISCGSNLTTSTPIPEPPPLVTADLSAATPSRRRSFWVVLLMPLGWALPWALGGWIGEMLSPWPISALVITIAGAIGGLITGLAIWRTHLPMTLKSSASAALRFAISWMIGWIIGWSVLAIFVDAIFRISSQVGYGFDTEALRTATLAWAGIWGVTGTIAGIIAGVISAISLGRLSRRAGQAIESKRVLIVAIGNPLGWILGWTIGGAVGAVAGAIVGTIANAVLTAAMGSAAVGTLVGAICGAICGGVIFKQYH